ncbi:single-stranded DNA exonuclease RecJ [Carnobacterium jeotgali]|uniref:single-stranded DNA exonuclease RecJ n=1 Tax=Carnobacterium jeotgali TaxID=545534 RepID=UPI00388FB113
MLKSRTKWKLNEPIVDHEKVTNLSKTLSLSSLFIELCLQRGLDSKEKIEQFIQPNETWIYDPYLMHDMERAVSRIIEAVEQGEQITIYGDYDAGAIRS